jgi:ribosomal protein L11 methylase PrmA
MSLERLGASFRDPSGFVFRHDGAIYRQINNSYARHYELLMSSGLYDALVGGGSLVAHEEIAADRCSIADDSERYKLIKPAVVPYVSYPYEWCFSQLKDAALLTLSIQATALQHGLILKDASAYNIQFVGSKPIFIDTLSFEQYREGEPWIAYRQFCQHFLGPLALMAFCDVRTRHLLRSFIDGLPVDLVSRLLPRRTLARYSILAHIHLHAASQKRHEKDGRAKDIVQRSNPMSRTLQQALVTSLQRAIGKFRLRNFKTEWADYYDDTNYSADSMVAKEALVAAFVDSYVAADDIVHDFGANTGKFSRLIAATGRYVLSHDIDELAVERNYLFNKKNDVGNVLPLVLDLNNPSPALGWALEERESLAQRAAGGVVLALALIHHIVISNNVPMSSLASYFHKLARILIIEFVPKDDSQVRRLLATREDKFPDYDIDHFRQEFSRYFAIREAQPIRQSGRTLFVLERL